MGALGFFGIFLVQKFRQYVSNEILFFLIFTSCFEGASLLKTLSLNYLYIALCVWGAGLLYWNFLSCCQKVIGGAL